MAPPATRSGLSPGALGTILIASGILALIFGLILFVGGISNIGRSVGSGGLTGLAATMGSVVPIAYILFAVVVFCLAYAYNVRGGYIAGGCFIGLAVAAWVFTAQSSAAGMSVLGIAMGALALVAGIFTDRTVTNTTPLMGVPRYALKAGMLILFFGVFTLAGMLMLVVSYMGMDGAMLAGGFALAGTAALLGGFGGILLFMAFLKAPKPTPGAPRAAAPPKKVIHVKPAPPKAKTLLKLKSARPPKPAPPKIKAPPKLAPAQIERMVYGYIVDYGGEIEIAECARELKISKSDVEKAVKSLVKKGKLEAEK